MTIPVGTTVYFSWWDFQKQCQRIAQGEVVDNSLYDGTRWQHWLNVQFRLTPAASPICHHFPADKLSTDPLNVPDDDCSLIYGRKQKATPPAESSAGLATVPTVPAASPAGPATTPVASASGSAPSSLLLPSDPWQAVRKFKEEHWDQERNHLRIDALNDFYRLWRIAVAARYGVTIEEAPVTVVAVDPGSPDGDKSATIIVDTETGEILPELPAEVEHRPIVSEERYQELKEKMKVKLTKKQKNSTGRIEYTDSIQTSFFD